MSRIQFPLAATLASILGAACGDAAGPAAQFADTTYVRVLHTAPSAVTVDVRVADRLVITNLALGISSQYVPVPSGNQPIEFRPAGGQAAGHQTTLPLVTGDSITLLTIDSAAIINPFALSDSGGTVPQNASKLRAVHVAEGAPAIDAWRTQPDFQSLVPVQFPFPFQTTSPYLQSDPGAWTVLVTTQRRDGSGNPILGDSLAASGNITIPAGESRTVVVLMQSDGTLGLSVVVP